MVTYPPVLIARITKEEDFIKLNEMVHCHDDWTLAYEKNDMKVWSRAASDSTIRMIKIWTIFSSISSVDLYNTLMDPDYRKVWDSHLLVFYDIGYLNFNNEVTYYAASFPPPLRSRDFVLQTSWLNRSTEYFILNHSVCHKDHPPRSGFIRAVSHFTGYVIKGMPQEGCEMFFVSQTDLQGTIPNWVVAKCTQIFAPRIVKQVEKAAAGYSAWKSLNNPSYFPWINPEQIKASVIPVSDCVASDKEKQSPFFKSVLEYCTHTSECTQNTSAALNGEIVNSPAGSSTISIKAVSEPKRKWRPSLRMIRPSLSRKQSKKENLKSFFQLVVLYFSSYRILFNEAVFKQKKGGSIYEGVCEAPASTF